VFRNLLIFSVAVVWFAGCTQQPAAPASAERSVAIEGVTWQLMSFGTHAMTVPQKAWIELENGKYTGFAGCNGLSGTYEKRGNAIRFTMDPHTMMACPDIRGENEFRKRLLQVDRYEYKDGMLKFEKGDEPLLEFMKKD
jgi:heat shock protein HslJ